MSDRRTFVKRMGGLGLACSTVGITALLESCGPSAFITGDPAGAGISIPLLAMEGKDFLVVKNSVYPASVFLRPKGDSYEGLLMLCDHMGCEVKPSGKYFVCPCHGSEFDSTGKVLKAPAKENLLPMKVTVEGGKIVINDPRS
jgi:Rieske Fe-S protein